MRPPIAVTPAQSGRPAPLHELSRVVGYRDERTPNPDYLPCSSAVSLALLYSIVRFLLDAILTRHQSELRLQAEVFALRHQLRVLERQLHRPRWQPADRVLLTA